MKKCILILSIFISITASTQELTVIGNNNAVPSQFSFAGLQTVFLGKQAKWSNGDKVVIALMKVTTDAGRATCSKLYRMSPDEVTKYWLSLSFKGTIDAPVFFNTTGELQNFVSATRGAIGIINVPATAANTKTVLVDGKKVF